MNRVLKYVGKDDELIRQLKQHSLASGWRWTEFEEYKDLEFDLRHRNQSQPPEQLSNGVEFQQWLRNRFAPIVVDLDIHQSEAVEFVRNIKLIDGGVPLIVISQQPSLRAYSIARMDGAEAFYIKPFDDVDGLIAGIEAAFEKIDRWERTLLRLQNHSNQQNTPPGSFETMHAVMP
jgi:DNA-binding NtrC family response regulator